MDKVCIVILNYLNYKDTIECVESIYTDEYINREIIIVDNGSDNDSWQVLNKKYSTIPYIHLIKSNENLGFSKGNNLGIQYARNELECSFILLVNNDTIFKDKMMITKLMQAYEPKVALIGPRIVEANNLEQNPVPVIVNKRYVEAKYNEIVYKQPQKNGIYNMLRKVKILRYIKAKLLAKNKCTPNYPSSEISETKSGLELVLHGACMLLTKDYFQYYDKLFPETFLYYEENIITLLTQKVNLEKKFINDTWIYHKEDQSSLMSFNNLSEIKQSYELDSVKKCLELFELSYEQISKKYFGNMK